MKKLFLAFTAFAGMLTGLSLTSCGGGGGGGGNLSGTVFDMGRYKIILNEQVEGIKNFYDADITDPSEDHYTEARVSLFNVNMENGKLKSAQGTVNAACFSDSSFAETFVKIFWDVNDVDVNLIQASNADDGSMFTITTEGGNSVSIKWLFGSAPSWTGSINGANEERWLIPYHDDEEDSDVEEAQGLKEAIHTGYVLY